MQHPSFLTQYQVLGFLGQGSYGRVMKVKSRANGTHLAAKIISLEGLSPNQLYRTSEQQRIHSCLRHPNIISVYESFLEKDQLVIVMEYCEYGDLHYYIKKKAQEKGYFEEGLIMNIFIQILFGLQYLHENKIVHRDLKPSNIFVDSEGRAKLADFGLSKTLTHSQSESSFGVDAMVGTPLYLAPEICANQSPSFYADIWAVGCVLYELCALQPPFLAGNILALATMIAQSEAPDINVRYSDNLNALVKWMLEKSPKNRPKAQQILKLTFVQKITQAQFHSNRELGDVHHQYEQDEIMRQSKTNYQIVEHEAEIEQEDDNLYFQKLHESCVQLLGSQQLFQQMYCEIKSLKERNVIINDKDKPKILSELLQIYGEEYFDIAKGVSELIDLEEAGRRKCLM